MSVRVVVVDDRRLVAEALASALRVRGHRVLGAGAPAGRGADLVVGKQPDVCLLGSREPEAPGALDPVRRIRRECPRVAVVVLGPVPSPRGVAAAFAAGARGYVRHDERIEGVERAMVKAKAGEAAVAPQLLRDAFAELLHPRSGVEAEGARLAALLTEREADVLVRIVEGEDTRRIAAGLGVAPSTARTHVQRLLTKLGTASRLEAAALAVRTGLADHLAARDGARGA
ncbi:response regulator transcription factor [Streptomyces marincola]|uniref:response regulator transcription factor n=1 Tax=Streptomyces marincola TaxID=2878388 RepID=UPI001CF54814|nr:response regulator transcription factor [Streptomyces marincola]UCM88535.1 response regulator transcription factor [Streptomyces marincola]